MRGIGAVVVFGALVASGPAFAHGLTPGTRGIYVAFLHTLSEMPIPFALVALGLLLGLNGLVALKWAWPAIMLGIVVGIVGLMVFRVFIDPEWPLLLLTFIAAAWAASGIGLPSSAAAIAGCCVGYLLGVFIAPGPASWSTQACAIAGGLIAVNVAVVCTFSVTDLIRERWSMPWITIALRVVASWIAAVAALVAALSLR